MGATSGGRSMVDLWVGRLVAVVACGLRLRYGLADWWLIVGLICYG